MAEERRFAVPRPGVRTLPDVASDWPAALRWLVRAGFVARAVTYGLIGAIVIGAAAHSGGPSARPDQQGALELVAGAPLGRAALVLIAIGLAAYALWKLVLAAVGTGPEGRADTGALGRVSNLAGAAVYVAFCIVAVRVLTGSHSSEPTTQRQAAKNVLNWPGGHVLVIAAGAMLVGISAYQLLTALRGHFARDNDTSDMSSEERAAFLLVGRVGLTARAVVFALVGYFLIRAAIDAQPSKAAGLDTALSHVHRAPFGTVLLLIVAAGLLAFAAFSLFEARYQRL